ncbi:galactokinase [Paenibacillus sp. J2TS4]|uniref:galactokinase n=1 Tax=Paenibacillus sp. J2TS4 TaxID=2807194 RepID=UPI001B2DE533|nr:galactokinase [Paenibacillus sp. J2TS4]GIP33898.1 galactokinase [Paenibacillus sp. J2TS4]
MNRQAMKEAFIQQFGGSSESIRCFYAPGRVNLIGEHTDYNGGYVFPAALTFGTTMLIRPRSDREIRLASGNFELQGTIDLDRAEYVKEEEWINYPKGILVHLQKNGYTFGGYDVYYYGNIPNGAGLSSSASLQLVTAFGFMSMEGHPIDRVELALVAQRSENEFLGVKCGIMDQFTVAMGKRDHALLLKCNTLDYEPVPFDSRGYKLVIGNTNKRRGLVDSEYNMRRSQCEQAAQELRAKHPGLQLLGELDLDQFEDSQSCIKEETVRKRAQHVIEENDRVLKSVEALKKNDLPEFGRLMTASHDSLRDLYEVTCRELDVMVEEALQVDGVLGSRMTGAGFGGCTVSLVREDAVDAFIRQVGTAYQDKTGLQADFYVASIGDGVSELADCYIN